ncbi:MAG: RnfABCDGE type electron transport complex subunit D [Spirochaetales bacterium]|nr:RnfABCDGE type electron transport complex subunit D [Spirochaetales bacterium]
MEKKSSESLEKYPVIEVSPHLKATSTTFTIMWAVSISLIPAALWGVISFGWYSLVVLLASIISAVAAEGLVNWGTKRLTIHDGSAFLTGLLIGFNMPPEIPIYIPVIGSFFAILVVKAAFGGLGSNWMNPALAGRVFVFFSFNQMGGSCWKKPRFLPEMVDSISSATPLSVVKSQGAECGINSFEFLKQMGYSHSAFDAKLTDFFNSSFGLTLPNGYFDAFVGNIPGCIGEVSALLLILGGIFLLAKKIITWHIPVAYIVSFLLFSWIFGGLQTGSGYFSGDAFFHLFTGGVILAAFYMATDMATSPVYPKGLIIYGVLLGFFTFFIRVFGSFPEGASLAILFMNMFVPMINKLTKSKPFGYVKTKKEAK